MGERYAHVTLLRLMFWDKEVEEKGGGQGCIEKVSIKAWGTELSHFFAAPPP